MYPGIYFYSNEVLLFWQNSVIIICSLFTKFFAVFVTNFFLKSSIHLLYYKKNF